MEKEAQSVEMHGQDQDRGTAIDVVAVARCHREATCGNVGDGKAYSSRPTCEAAMREPTREQLPRCGAFSRIVLDQCMQDIRMLRCESDLTTVENVESCRQPRLCKG